MQFSEKIAEPGQASRKDPLAALRRTFGVDVRSLAAVRMGLGALLLLDLALRARHLRAHYSDSGILPRSELELFSLHALSGSPVWCGFLFALAAVFALLLLAGWRTRLATVASWVLLISLHLRNPYLCDSGDRLLSLLLLWGMFLPLGSCASIDALLSGRPARAREVVLSVASTALLFQVAFVYLFSAIIKEKTLWLVEGSALHYALHVDMVTTRAGRALLEYPGLLRFASRATLLLEFIGPILCFVPVGTAVLRTIVPLVFIVFHLALVLALDIGLFPYVCIVAWLAFLPPEAWNRLSGIVQGRDPRSDTMDIADARHGLSRLAGLLAAILLAYVFLWNVVTLSPKGSPPAVLAWPGEQLRLRQRWAMFSAPPREDGWWVMPVRLRDGSEVDLHTGASPVAWEKPADVAATFESPRIWKWLTYAWGPDHRGIIAQYGAWLRRDWNERHGPERAVLSQKIHYMLEETGPPGEEPIRAKLTIYEWSEAGGERVVGYEESFGNLERRRPGRPRDGG